MKTFCFFLAITMPLFLGSCAKDSKSIDTWDVSLELLEATAVPELSEIKPYDDALVAFRYRLKTASPVKKTTPTFLAEEVIVLHWAIRDRKPVSTLKYMKKGDIRTLKIQRFADRPDLKGRYIKNGLDAFDLLLFAEAEE